MDNQSTPQNPTGGTEFPPVPGEKLNPNMPEQPQSSGEAMAAPGSAAPAGPPQPAAAPPKLSPADVAAAIAAVPGGAPMPAATVGMPATADDVDLIEPEWVAKAEDEVRKHAGDPYGEEEAIEDVQQDYLKKRYGYNVADPGGPADKLG